MTTVVQVNAAQFSHSIEFHDSEARRWWATSPVSPTHGAVEYG